MIEKIGLQNIVVFAMIDVPKFVKRYATFFVHIHTNFFRVDTVDVCHNATTISNGFDDDGAHTFVTFARALQARIEVDSHGLSDDWYASNHEACSPCSNDCRESHIDAQEV